MTNKVSEKSEMSVAILSIKQTTGSHTKIDIVFNDNGQTFSRLCFLRPNQLIQFCKAGSE